MELGRAMSHGPLLCDEPQPDITLEQLSEIYEVYYPSDDVAGEIA